MALSQEQIVQRLEQIVENEIKHVKDMHEAHPELEEFQYSNDQELKEIAQKRVEAYFKKAVSGMTAFYDEFKEAQ